MPSQESIPERLDTIYRMRTELAEHKAATWESIAKLLMEQNHENVEKLVELKRTQENLAAEMQRELARITPFIEKAEDTLRRALAALDGTSNEDKTEVREAIAAILKQ